MGDYPKVMYSGKVAIGNKELSCGVLDDGTRILLILLYSKHLTDREKENLQRIIV